ncbi:MAG: hypothetical protein ACFFHD_07065 [Promethearchaeota archaeon]
MEQIESNCISVPECVEIEVCIEKTQKEKKQTFKQLNHKESIKYKLIKLFRIKKRNAKYIKEVIPIQRLVQRRVFRDYGMR